MTWSPKGENRHPTNILPGDTKESLSLASGTLNALDWTQHCSKSTGKNSRLEYLNFQVQFCFGLSWCQALGYCSSGRQWCQRSRLLPWERHSARLTQNFFQVSPNVGFFPSQSQDDHACAKRLRAHRSSPSKKLARFPADF